MEILAVANGVFRLGRSLDPSPAILDPSAALEGLETAAGRAVVESERVSFLDDAGLVASFDGLVKLRPEGERYFACGERTAGLEKTGTRQVFWNVDPPAGHTASFNNLYTSIPFVLCLHQGRAHGVFYDHPGRIELDLAKADPSRVVVEAADDLAVYVLLGPTPADVLDRYTALTGRTPMPPLWALGNQQSRWSYMSADEVRSVAREFRSRGIPCDVLYLDIDYMDGYRVFTWDEERYPDPAGLIAELRDEGFRVVVITDPGVKVDERYPVYVEGRERGFFCLTSDGSEFRNVVWPGLCAFPDFTNPAVREWWGSLHAGLLEAGVAGVWCDMNEPSLFVPQQSTMPEDVVHPGGGRARKHGSVHNAYGSLMAEAARGGLSALRPDARPFVITRAGYAGLQRHALQWTGDNSSWWEHLWMSMPQLQNLGLSGIAWSGVDIGGFFGDCDGELLARWTEFGAFQPFCRNHTAMGTVPQEPWAFGEPWESVCRSMLELRMQLVPYLYTLFEECHRTGAPVLRPLLFSYPDDPTTYKADDQFMVGDALLVAPITRPGIEHRHVYLPAGAWSHFFTGERFDGPAHILAHAPLGRPAVFARCDTPIPMWPVLQHTSEVPSSLTWKVFVGPGSGSGALYEDAGDGFGPGSRRTAQVERGGDIPVVRFSLSARSGSFVPPRRETFVEFAGGDRVRLEETGEAVVIERAVTNDD
jgi:alpha-glucosidase